VKPNEKYPKVLMVGKNCFCREQGCGITMTNLFKGWAKDRIAVLTYEEDSCEDDICDQSYLLGFDEIRMIWPFSLFQNKAISGVVGSSINKVRQKSVRDWRKGNLYLLLKKNVIKVVRFLGLYPLLFEIRISKKLLRFIDEYNPDIVHSRLANRILINFVDKLYCARKIPIVLHIEDDWPRVIGQEGVFQFFVKRKINKEFRNLLNKASGLMGISQEMCDEYKKRYGRIFLPFSNPVESEKWLGYSKTNWSTEKTFRILYAGRIGRVNAPGILDLCKAIEKFKDMGLDVRLDIYSKDTNFVNSRKNKIPDNVNINNPLPHEEMPHLLASYDLLFLPLGFKRADIILTQYSMPTKISEYMISGTPILVYASSKTALYKYAKAEKSAYLVSERNIDKLSSAIKELYLNEQVRQSLGEKAKETAIKNHDATKVRSNFRKALITMYQCKENDKV